MVEHDEVFNEIKSIIKENGNVNEDTRNRLILLALTGINDKVEDALCLAEKVDTNRKDIEILLKNNILLWIKNNKSLAAAIVISFLLLGKVLLPLIHYGLSLAGVPDDILILIF